MEQLSITPVPLEEKKKQLFKYRYSAKNPIALPGSSVQNGGVIVVTASSNNVQHESDVSTSAENNASKNDGNENSVIKIISLADIEPH